MINYVHHVYDLSSQIIFILNNMNNHRCIEVYFGILRSFNFGYLVVSYSSAIVFMLSLKGSHSVVLGQLIALAQQKDIQGTEYIKVNGSRSQSSNGRS